MNMNPTILTKDGSYFNFQTPWESTIDIGSIAHALSHICRFTGHTRQFYSVAQHSYMTSMIVPPQFALQALLHDAAEAYIGDVASPLKQMLPEYKRIEHEVEEAVLQHFGITLPLDASIKRADLVMLATEARDLLPKHTSWFAGTDIQPLKETLVPLDSYYAKKLFINRFNLLNDARGAA